MILSSSAVHGPRLMEGSEWFLQCDLHCLAVRAGWPSFEKSCDANPSATTRHFLTPWMPTKSTNALSSSLDQTLLSFFMCWFCGRLVWAIWGWDLRLDFWSDGPLSLHQFGTLTGNISYTKQLLAEQQRIRRTSLAKVQGIFFLVKVWGLIEEPCFWFFGLRELINKSQPDFFSLIVINYIY